MSSLDLSFWTITQTRIKANFSVSEGKSSGRTWSPPRERERPVRNSSIKDSIVSGTML